jgi:phage-related protein
VKTLRYGGVPIDEQEVVIRLDAEDGMAHISSTWPAWSRKFERLHGTPPRYAERNGAVQSAFWTLPLRVISIRRAQKSSGTRSKTGHFTAQTSEKVAV